MIFIRIRNFTLCAIVMISLLCHSVTYGQTCERWLAKAVSVQGGVESLRAGERQWRRVRLNDTFCSGDMIRLGKLSRADVVLTNDSTLRLDQNTTVTFSEPVEEKTFIINLAKGAAYFFSRVRRSLKVLTPFANASVEGTEFYARVEGDKTFISMFEGRVAFSNEAGSITLTKGQSAIAEAGRAPVFHVVLHPRDAVQWTLYYPPVLYYRPSDFQAPTGWQQAARKSIELYMEGNLQGALGSLEGITEEISDSRFFAYRASLFLSVGRVDEARSDIEKALSLSPNDSQGLALQSVIALAQNEKEKALNLAKKAVEADPHSSPAQISLSYAFQADFDIKGALDSLKEAVKSDSENGLAWARLSEIWLSYGDLDKALEAAKKSVDLNPNISRTQTVLGFAYLTQIETKKAKEAFQKAIVLDQADPLPRLGMGLAMIRDGDLALGRAEIEIAASLDPNSSLIRSYLGKAYYEEKRDKLASNQFDMAKDLDPSDPTPFFYDAIRKQSVNQPVEALQDLQKSIELNDNRAVYRSRLLLDSDLAARSASLGRIYSDLGFQQLALVEGWKSVNVDPANFSAHRFLADSYAALPRHEIARVSELLQSQLLQPININPVQPHLAESNLLFLEGAGPTDPSFNEFNPLFNRNRLALQTNGIVGNQNTWGEEVVQSGVWGPLSYSAGQFHYTTDGFRKNNDLDKDIYNLFVQGSLSYKTSLQAEFRYSDITKGDRSLNFFSDDFLPDLRNKENNRSLRAGFHHSFSAGSDLIGSFIYQDGDAKMESILRSGSTPILSFEIKMDSENYGSELQYLFRRIYFNLVAGSGFFNIDRKEKFQRTFFIFPGTSIEFRQRDVDHSNFYLYSQINYPKNVTLTVGASTDIFESGLVDRKQINPKFGLTWTPFANTTFRGAVFRVLKRSLITNQTLEPTQIAGFNQFFDETDGTDSWRYGFAADQKFSKNIYGGVEFSRRRSDVPFVATTALPPPATPISVTRKSNWEERFGRAYFYWTPHPWVGLSSEYQYEKFDREKEFTAGIKEVRTHRFPLGINFYHPSGLSARLKATYMDQKGKFQPQNQDTPTPIFISGEDQFLVLDASISYRLPKRLGMITVGAKNLFDKSFKYQDTDPFSPVIQPERLIFGRFTLAF